MKTKSVGLTGALNKHIGARILQAAMQMMTRRNDDQEARREKSRYNRDEARKSYLKGRARWFSGVARHDGKGCSHRANRKSLGITARQQKRARKALGRLPHMGDFAKQGGFTSTVERAIAKRWFAKHFGGSDILHFGPGSTLAAKIGSAVADLVNNTPVTGDDANYALEA